MRIKENKIKEKEKKKEELIEIRDKVTNIPVSGCICYFYYYYFNDCC